VHRERAFFLSSSSSSRRERDSSYFRSDHRQSDSCFWKAPRPHTDVNVDRRRNRPDSSVRQNGFIARVVRGSIVAKFIHRIIPFIRFQRTYSTGRMIRRNLFRLFAKTVLYYRHYCVDTFLLLLLYVIGAEIADTITDTITDVLEHNAQIGKMILYL